MRKLTTFALFLSLVLLPGRGFAGEPTVQLSATINELVTIMINTSVAELRSTGMPDKALKLIHGRFDFAELTKRSLGPHWKTLLPAEQNEFIDGLTYRLLVTYGRTLRASDDARVVFKKETLDGKYAKVESLVVSGKSDTSIEYRLHDVDGQWRVYDMVIEQVSLISNFRAQFERKIARISVKGLLEEIKQRES